MSHNRFTLYPYRKLALLCLTLLLAFNLVGCAASPVPPILPGQAIPLFEGTTAAGLKAAVLDNAAYSFTLMRGVAPNQWIVAWPMQGGFGFSAMDVKTGFSLTSEQLCGQAVCAKTLNDIMVFAENNGWKSAPPSPGLVALVQAFINAVKTPMLIVFPIADDGSVDFWQWIGKPASMGVIE